MGSVPLTVAELVNPAVTFVKVTSVGARSAGSNAPVLLSQAGVKPSAAATPLSRITVVLHQNREGGGCHQETTSS
jgi:hypothetical protein